jgi:hypothetical protein
MPETATPEVAKTAHISDCGMYRYELTRTWDATVGRVCWIMLNPSAADAAVDDPTIRRCMGFARDWGYGGITVLNLFAYRATDPRHLVDANEAGIEVVGPLNAQRLCSVAPMAPLVVAAWGTRGSYRNQAAKALQLLAGFQVDVLCLGTTKDGHPRHPLYVPAGTPLEILRRADA